jgi:pimeloyl-ACP methyl ester carboxylesterase
MKKTSLIILMGILCVFAAKSQQLASNYLLGDIDVKIKRIGIILIIETSPENKAGLYIPEQMAYNIEASDIYVDNDSISLKFKTISSELTGKIVDNEISGFWKQGSGKYPVNLKFITKEDAAYLNLERPQTPQPPFPYIEKEIIVENKKGDVQLGGTLTIPDTISTFPLVIMVTGSGAQDRNEEIAGHKPFMVIADYLTRNGVAVFRYDDRGVGKSTGLTTNSTTEDFMEDAVSILKYFKNYPNINPKKIGILGHSEGGTIAIMAAATYPKDIAFIISLAGVAANIKELNKKQVHDINVANGTPMDIVQILDEMQEELLNAFYKTKDQAEFRKKVIDIYDAYAKEFNEEQQKQYSINRAGANMAIMQFSSPWVKYFFRLDPPKYIKKIKCSVLVLNGDKDIQVDLKMNLSSFEKNINKKKAAYIEIHELEGLNHLFQQAEKGNVDEYFRITQTIDENVLIIIKNFIEKI